jgi:hypothetical protein
LDREDRLRAIRGVVAELIVYGGLVALYAVSVLQFLADPLANLYEDNLTLYAWVALALIVAQGVVLDGVTSFLLDRLRLARFD